MKADFITISLFCAVPYKEFSALPGLHGEANFPPPPLRKRSLSATFLQYARKKIEYFAHRRHSRRINPVEQPRY